MSDTDSAVGPTLNCNEQWQILDKEKVYRCLVVLCPEDVGFSVYVSQLPGVVSQGENGEEAIQNITEACQAAIESYLDGGEPIPWTTEFPAPPVGAKERWIVVNV